MTVGVHVRPQVELVVVLCDFDDSRQIARLKARLKDEVVRIEGVGLSGQQVLGATHTGSRKLRHVVAPARIHVSVKVVVFVFRIGNTIIMIRVINYVNVLEESIKTVLIGVDSVEAEITFEFPRVLDVIEIIIIVEALLHLTSDDYVALADLLVSVIAPKLKIIFYFLHVNVILITPISSHYVSSFI